ncbi:ATP-binding cassette domain-containing protein [Barnesiella sp. An55]|uniref:ABC transporter ATP-binding protein n=1 Tax=Barnesiella sp. An55 TaxID=1965646 RepID=UPI000B366B4E|nr:ATP-binding cassette domain-containing protein [Barnesiella sp. An55]OUN74676.1 ABC transporter ATP-binding protein [Barnesiella sp. An55]
MYYLEANHIVKQYASHRALDDVTVRVPRNGIYGLLGPNGAGKTTLIRIINQITAPDEGEVLIEGRPLCPSDVEHIGYLPEERGLYKKMKVGEQILYLAQLKGLSRKAAKESMDYWLGKFDIKGWEKKKIEELSKGMQQKIQFITTVMHNPQLLIFDEPFSGFDPVNANLLKREILEMRDKGATIIFSTHNMASVEELCDEITLINRSHVVLQGEVAEIRQQHKKHLFQVEVQQGELQSNDLYEIIGEQALARGHAYTLRKRDTTMSNNELIGLITQQCQIAGFEEILPTMNEIFIETVGESALEEKQNV